MRALDFRALGALAIAAVVLGGCAHADRGLAGVGIEKGSPVILLEKKRDLVLKDALGCRNYLSAASDLVLTDRYAYVIADDELSMGIFEWRTQEPGVSAIILPGKLPDDPVERKKLKPDLEACVSLEDRDGIRSLLAIPSGSRKTRWRGANIKMEGAKPKSVAPVDFFGIFNELEKSIVELNIEGAAHFESQLVFLHRGNDPKSQNAVIVLDRDLFLKEVADAKLTKHSVKKVVPIEVGEVNGVRLSFTSGTFDSQGRLWFVAAAEATESTYADGSFLGAVIGRLDADLTQVDRLHPLDIKFKPEGLAFDPHEPGRFYLVTDADDPQSRAGFFSGRLD